MPTVTLSLSDEDYAEIRPAKNRSAKLRELLAERRTHKCPEPQTVKVKVFLREAAKKKKGWQWDQWEPDKKDWVPVADKDL